MTFKVKNTIYLTVVLVILTLVGVGIYSFWQPRQLKAITKKNDQIKKQLQDLPGLTEDVQRLTEQFQDVKRRYDSRSKEIPLFDVSSQTYAYMSRGIDESGFLKFDMKFLNSTDNGRWGYNTYMLTQGEAEFQNLFKFIYFLENGTRLYKIANLGMDVHEKIDPESQETNRFVSFYMELHAYFVDNIPELGTSLAAKYLTVVPSIFDPLKPIINQVISSQPPANEIDADNSDVKAVLPGKAFVLFNNELLVLHVGDHVWRGSVTAINPSESSVEYALEEGGIVRKLIKRIKFDKIREVR